MSAPPDTRGEHTFTIDTRWDDVPNKTLRELARIWFWESDYEQQTGEPPGPHPDLDGETGRETVVRMNFTAGPDPQWRFIEAAVAEASRDDHLLSVAAGPVEHLLWKHGEAFIGRVEERVAADPKWRTLIGGVWRHGMSDAVWSRVEALKDAASG